MGEVPEAAFLDASTDHETQAPYEMLALSTL